VLRGALVPDAPPTVTRFLRVDGDRHFVYAYERGLYEPLVELGDQVKAGQPAAWVHFPDTPLREPVLYRFKGDGEVVCKRVPAQVQRGDCLFQLAEASTPPRVIA
jgi:predicted deacylase